MLTVSFYCSSFGFMTVPTFVRIFGKCPAPGKFPSPSPLPTPFSCFRAICYFNWCCVALGSILHCIVHRKRFGLISKCESTQNMELFLGKTINTNRLAVPFGHFQEAHAVHHKHISHGPGHHGHSLPHLPADPVAAALRVCEVSLRDLLAALRQFCVALRQFW